MNDLMKWKPVQGLKQLSCVTKQLCLLTVCLLIGELFANELFSSPSIWLMRPGVQVGKPSTGLTFDALLGFQPTADSNQVLALSGRVINHAKKVTTTVHTPANH